MTSSICIKVRIDMQEKEALELVNSMLEHDALSQLVYRLRHFNESVPEEAEAVQKLLSVFENLIEVKPDVAEQLVQMGDNKTGFLRRESACNDQCTSCALHQLVSPDTAATMQTHKRLCRKTKQI